MPDFKAYLRNCIDSFFNKSSNRQLMSAAAYPSSTDPITVASNEDANDGWKIIAKYTAPCDGVLAVEGKTITTNSGHISYLWASLSCFKSASFMQLNGKTVGNICSVIVRKGELVRVDADSVTDIKVTFYKSQGSV